MTDVLSVTGPIYLLILLGFAAVRSSYMPGAATEALGAFVLRICLPALIFSAVTGGAAQAAIHWPFVAAYATGSLAALLAGALVLRGVAGLPPGAATIGGLGMALSNSVFVGYPLVLATFGGVADRVFTWVLLVENALVLPLALIAADILSGGPGKLRQSLWRTVRRLAANPLLLSLAAGLAAAALDLTLPGPLARAVATLRAAAPGIALFVVGAIAATLEVRRLALPVLAVTAGKLLLHPVLVALALALMPGVGGPVLAAGIVFAACPMVSIFAILAARFGAAQMAGAAFIAATALSFLTVGATLYLLAG